LPQDGEVRPLLYANEPYQGHPTRVFGYYAEPPSKVKVPGMVLVHGGGGKAFREWAELWAKRGYAAIAMDLAGKGPDGQRLPDGGPDQGHKEKFDDVSGGVTNAWPYHAVAAVIRAHSLLRSLPNVDAQRTGITGISWGGYLTCMVAGVDNRFKVAVPVYGCGFIGEGGPWPNLMRKLSVDDHRIWIENFDPARYLQAARMPMLFVNGTNDFAYPLDIYQDSYRLGPGPRTLCITVNMPHSHQHGWAPQEIGLFVDSVLRGGAGLARLEPVVRNGPRVVVEYHSPSPIREAALHYTTDGGNWKERKWQTAPARLEHAQAMAELPAVQGITYFLTLKDDRGAVVSTPHEVLEP
jgi:dienelactone hydrolase